MGACDGDLARQTGEFSSLEAWLAFMQDYFDRPGGFAFETSLHGIRLLHDLKGAPTVLGDVSSTDPHLHKRMAEWRTIAQRLAEGSPEITIVLPSEYVLFRTIDGEVSSQADQDWWTEQIVREKQLTRADVSVACQRIEERTFLAIVELQTLREANDFASSHGFWVSRFLGRPARKMQATEKLPGDPFVFRNPSPLVLQVQE